MAAGIDSNAERYVSLTTFRKDGREVRTPVWIAAAPAGRAYVYTNGTSGKVKRIRNHRRVLVAPCDLRGTVHGELSEATARLIDDPEERERGLRAFVEKYGWQMRLALLMSRLSGRYRDRAIVELSFEA